MLINVYVRWPLTEFGLRCRNIKFYGYGLKMHANVCVHKVTSRTLLRESGTEVWNRDHKNKTNFSGKFSQSESSVKVN